MKNPWTDLPESSPFVLPGDQAVLATAGGSDHFGFCFEIYPDPYWGSPTEAAILLLTLNPGFSAENLHLQGEDEYRRANFAALSFEGDPPAYFLHPRFAHTGGYRYWVPRLREFVQRFGLETVSQKFMAVQYVGYHSEIWKEPPLLPSQRYAFYLVREAIRAGKEIVIMRGKRKWLTKVEELRGYGALMTVSSPHNPHVSRKQLESEPGRFDRLMSRLEAEATRTTAGAGNDLQHSGGCLPV
jgi:hypothetical protein